MRIELTRFNEGGGLAGMQAGLRVRAEIMKVLPQPTSPEVLLLDFSDVEVATASFVRECVLGIRDYCRQENTNLYPVVANASEAVLEDLSIVLAAKGDAIAVCRTDSSGNPLEPRVLGRLEAAQAQTLDAIAKLTEADAKTLHDRYSGDIQIGTATAWNNRLSALAAKALLIEEQRGRGKTYRCVLPGLCYGS